MVLESPGQPLAETDRPVPHPSPGEVLVRIHACAVCRTDLHVIDGELPNPKLPLIPGHEIVGEIVEIGKGATGFKTGERVGIPWLGWTCGKCRYCRTKRENLCDEARFTGFTIDGGYAEYTVADSRYCFRIPELYTSAEAAPLLCAGLIGYRSLCKAGDAERIGIYGFGAAAHIITQVGIHQGRRIFAFTRPNDTVAQNFARSLGAVWAGDSTMRAPEELDAAIIFATPGELIPLALKSLAKGGKIVCGGIHMSDIPSFRYDLLWQERAICSVANLTRQDANEFLALAPQVPVQTHVREFLLSEANAAIQCLRDGELSGAAVLINI